jgi:hypothetical protein
MQHPPPPMSKEPLFVVGDRVRAERTGRCSRTPKSGFRDIAVPAIFLRSMGEVTSIWTYEGFPVYEVDVTVATDDGRIQTETLHRLCGACLTSV